MRFRIALHLLLVALPATIRAQTESEYRLGPADVVHLQVLGRSDLSGDATTDDSGNLNLPLIGMVEAANRTTAELASQLTQRYGILDPRVTEVIVSVAQYNSRRVTVVGEVRSPGRYAFRTIPGLWDVLLEAGGPTQAADLSQVQIVRKERDASEPHVIDVDLSAGVKGSNPDSLPKLRPKDTVIVPSQAPEIAATSGASFQIFGAVRTPGAYRLVAAKTVVEALAVAGGPLPEADLQRVDLTRHSGNGVIAYRLDVEGHLRHGDPAADLDLKAGDTITVPVRSGANLLDDLLRFSPLVTAATGLIILFKR